MKKKQRISKLEIFEKRLKKIHQNKVDKKKEEQFKYYLKTIRPEYITRIDWDAKTILYRPTITELSSESCIHKLFKWLKK